MTNTHTLKHRACRLLCGMSIFAFVIFALVDPFMVPGSTLPLIKTRVFFALGSLAILGASWMAPTRDHPTFLGVLVSSWTGCGVVILTQQTGGPGSAYWPMVMLTFFTVSTVLPMKAWQAGISYGVVAIFYDVWMVLHNADASTADWAGSNAGIWLALIVSVLTVAFLDRNRQREATARETRNTLNKQLLAEINERKRVEKVIQRSQQLDAVGQLAAGLAHEINNVLMVISGAAEAIQRESTNFNPDLERITNSAHRGGRLTSGLLLFAREGTRENHPFCLNKVANNVADILQQAHRGRVQIVRELTEESLWVLGDTQLISQVILNLCLNGIDAMNGRGALQIQTRVVHRDSTQTEWIQLDIIDTGKGMTPQEQARAFEPFFTTKPPGKGTGLGLSMAYGTIVNHSGELTINSEQNKGTRLRASLPRIDAPMAQASAPGKANKPLPSATVLLVDDDPMVREIIRETLEAHGARVVEADNGAKATTLHRNTSVPIDLVILDMVMPVMNGEETFQRIRKTNPEQPILIYSGFAQDETITTLLTSGNCRFIRKPFRNTTFIQLIASMLNDNTHKAGSPAPPH